MVERAERPIAQQQPTNHENEANGRAAETEIKCRHNDRPLPLPGVLVSVVSIAPLISGMK